MQRHVQVGCVLGSLLAIAVLGLGACQHRTRAVEPPVVKTATPKATLVERSEAFEGNRLVAILKTYRFEEGTRGLVTWVQNPRNLNLGYITEDGRAFRSTAFNGEELVGNSRKVGHNVAAILGRPLASIKVKLVASAR